MSSGRNWRDHGLVAGAFSKGRARVGGIRWYRSLRTPRPAPGRATGLGHAHFQFWPQRGAQFSHRQRAFLARQISYRRSARGRRGLDALPRLFAETRPMDPERPRWPREPGCHLFFETVQRSLLRAFPRNYYYCRGINFVARRIASDLSGRTRVRFQMEHGLDARFPGIHEHRPDLPALSSRQHHLLAALRVPGELYSCAQPRRSGLRKAVVVIQNARRRMAKVCQSPDVSSMDVRPSREKTALHGRRIRPTERMESRHYP